MEKFGNGFVPRYADYAQMIDCTVEESRVRPRPYIWELRKNGQVIATEEQSGEDMEMNGRGYMLDAIIPDEHADAAQEGEWDEEGFNYSIGEDFYVVTYYRKPW